MQNASKTQEFEDPRRWLSQDELITRRLGGMFALDCGLMREPHVIDLDFISPTREECAEKIRANIGLPPAGGRHYRHAVRSPSLDSYEIFYTLIPHWSRKLRLIDIGCDPDVVMRKAQICGWKRWQGFPAWSGRRRMGTQIEFLTDLLVLEQAPGSGAEAGIFREVCAEYLGITGCEPSQRFLVSLQARLDEICFEIEIGKLRAML